MRTGLAVLIAVVQVAGSWLCCCGPDRLFAVRSAAVPAHCDEPAVASAAPASCPHCKQSGAASKPAPAKPGQPRKHPPLPDQCPCGGMKIEAVPVAVAVTAEQVLSGPALPAPFPADVAAPLTLTASMGVTLEGVSELPFLPTEDRLFVHHALLC